MAGPFKTGYFDWVELQHYLFYYELETINVTLWPSIFHRFLTSGVEN